MYKKVNGINYELIENSSSKENLVFIHGSGCNRKFLKPLAKKLKDFNCYLIDLPDHGESDNKNCTKVEDYIDAVAEFTSTIDNVTLIGHSLGGSICLGVSAKHIPSVKRNIIISSGARFDKCDHEVYDMIKNNKVNWLYLLKCCGSYLSLDMWLDLLTFEPAKVVLNDFAIDVKFNIANVMSDINIPSLIMIGGADILALPEYSDEMHEKIKDSKLIVIPQTRHMLPIAKSKDVANLIREFISINK
jgi:pimeloyl-ACP methyl ester carboxylesterase